MRTSISVGFSVNEDGQLVVSQDAPEGSGLSIDTITHSRKGSADLAVWILARQGKLRCKCGALFVAEKDRARCPDATEAEGHGL